MDGEEFLIAGVITAGLVMAAALVTGSVLMVRDTVRKRGRWGVNLKPVRCPHCDEPAPAVRLPKNARQTLWGGHTCNECGTEYDKWGDEVPGERGTSAP